MEKYCEKKQLLLGGNAGFRYHIAKAQKGIEKDIQNPIQKKFYKTTQGISMDNNFTKIFSSFEITNLYKNEKIMTLMNLFGYQQIE